MKADRGDGPGSKGQSSSKILGSKKERKNSKQHAIDIGVSDVKTKEDKEHNDSFEKYYNKDLDLDEGKLVAVGVGDTNVWFYANVLRLSASCHLWVERERHQLHFPRKFWKGADPLAESTDDARTNFGWEESSRQVCLSADYAQYGALLSETRCSWRVRFLLRALFKLSRQWVHLGLLQRSDKPSFEA